MVKVTLGWEIAYEFEVWIMDHHAGVDVILGTDFVIPAGVRLDLFNSIAKLPDEFEINLIKSANAREDTEYGKTICGGGDGDRGGGKSAHSRVQVTETTTGCYHT
ncbi:hypothetical protein PR002_g17040 [Phytophthora rubi]|uniref:Uncharacterized protein n=1 Tax=Phytophthora rubi TaxID=129364 RepID=A0A6A3KA23_9STRA|nr:hypothetical protein PR002_g17040 [Phytophthora rubi]